MGVLMNRPLFRLNPLHVMACMAWGLTMPTHAGTIDLGDGAEAVWSLSTSLSAGWRAKGIDKELLGQGDGGSGSAYTASANKNFERGENFSTLLRVIGDVNLRKDDYGLMLRAKAWDNLRLSGSSVPFGAPSNNYEPDKRLDDSQFDTNLSNFRGVELLDAYVYGSFDLGETAQLKVRLGQHVVNFGESLFVPGINQYQVLDVNALRQSGTLLKEAILPVPQLSANLGLGDGYSLEGYYQFKWKRTSIDGCGTYWSPATALNCTRGSTLVANDTVFGVQSSRDHWNGGLGGALPNFRFSLLDDKDGADENQFGLAFKKMVESIDTEIGAYYTSYTTHVPNLSGVRDLTTVPNSAYYLGGPLGSVFWDYSADKIRVFGLSASTVVKGWSVSGEVSFTQDFPVQISSVDGFYAMAAPGPGGTVGIGPMASRWGSTAAPIGSGTYNRGYDLKDKTQIQVSTLKLLSNVLGASSGTVLGEVAFQHWNGIGDPYTGVRYGRGFEFGAGPHAAYGGACPAAATNQANCTQDGYFTSTAWGVRALLELEYPGLISSVVVKPRLFISKDVKGWSADGVFSQGRHVIAPGVKFDVDKRYTLDISYTAFNDKARFDSFHDRDFFALVLGASF
ncbi:DUF1302 domain-containing protein [Aquabacterium soli]|uniref:DUF1302 domain-containing protein n=1 Tax=Aquabacterium soli TaxID=2493092 RepID=A0A426VGQ6_9BURK|nr:DUF1302 domain-containing protein [Aquabacterium soli]